MNRIGLLLTAFGVIVAAWLGWVCATTSVPDAIPMGDRVQAAVHGLRSSHVYVDPDSEGLLSPGEIAKVDAAAKASKPEAFVVLWRDRSEAGYYLSSQALDQIGAALDRPGYYIAAGPDGISYDDVNIKSDDYVSADDAVDYSDGLADGELATGLLKTIAENDGRDYSTGSTTGSQYWGGTIGTIAAGALFGALAGGVLAGILTAGWFIVRARRSTA